MCWGAQERGLVSNHTGSDQFRKLHYSFRYKSVGNFRRRLKVSVMVSTDSRATECWGGFRLVLDIAIMFHFLRQPASQLFLIHRLSQNSPNLCLVYQNFFFGTEAKQTVLHFLSASQEDKKEERERERNTKVNGIFQPTSSKAPFEGHTDLLPRVNGNERITCRYQCKIDTHAAYILSPENITSDKCALRWLHRCLTASLVKEADPATFFSKGYL